MEESYKKRISSLLIILVITLVFSTSGFAVDINTSPQTQSNNQSDIQSLSNNVKVAFEKEGFQVESLIPNADKSTFKSTHFNSNDKRKPIVLDSIDQIKDLKTQFKSSDNSVQNANVTLNQSLIAPQITAATTTTVSNGSGVASQ